MFPAVLSCTAGHPPSSLIAVIDQRDGDRWISGTLGCAECGAEYALRDGVAYLLPGDALPAPTALNSDDATSTQTVDPMRVAALLGLTEPGRRILLVGEYAEAAVELSQATDAVCTTLNAAPVVRALRTIEHVVIDARADRLPFPDGTFHGVAVDAAHLALLADAPRVLQRGARMLAPVQAAVPEGCTELARDATEWVAEVEAPLMPAAATVQLRRG